MLYIYDSIGFLVQVHVKGVNFRRFRIVCAGCETYVVPKYTAVLW